MKKGEKRRWQLLSVALDEFIAKGFYGTSTREIAKKAKISSGLLFHYFENKEAIYEELVKIGTEKMKIDVQTALMAPREYLEHMLKSTFELLDTNTFFAKMFVFIDDAQYVVVENKEIRKMLDENDICTQWVPVIEEGQRRGEFRDGNPHALCVALFGALQGIAQEKVRVPETPMPEVMWIMDIIK